MLRYLMSSVWALMSLALVTGTYANPPPLTTAPATTSISTLPSNISSTAPLIPIPTVATGKWCPWCDLPIVADQDYCNIIIQQAHILRQLPEFPAMIFNNDYTKLVRADMLSKYVSGKDWYLSDLKASIVLVFDPKRTLTDVTYALFRPVAS